MVRKPPLPPQSKPRHSLPHARKNYLVTSGGDPAPPPPPPSPQVSTAGLQVALQHFKESARQDRERLAKSVPDLAVIDLVHPPTSANQTRASSSTSALDRKWVAASLNIGIFIFFFI